MVAVPRPKRLKRRARRERREQSILSPLCGLCELCVSRNVGITIPIAVVIEMQKGCGQIGMTYHTDHKPGDADEQNRF